jgi:hypothetical protein
VGQNVEPTDDVSYDVTGSTPVEKEVWTHIALTRQNGYLKIWINGVLDGTSSVSDTKDIVNFQGFSTEFYFGQGFNGRMEEIRFSKGIARYTSNFTPRTTEYNTPTQSVPCNNMVIQSEGYEANYIPTSARVVIFEVTKIQSFNPSVVQEIIPNTDIKVYISRDGGTTFTQVTDLKIEMDAIQESFSWYLMDDVNFLVGTVDLSSQPNGKEMVYKITTHNNKDIMIKSVACNWR